MTDNLDSNKNKLTEPASSAEIVLLISLLSIIGTAALGFMGQTVSAQFSNVGSVFLTPA